jgi:hypothetical protein
MAPLAHRSWFKKSGLLGMAIQRYTRHGLKVSLQNSQPEPMIVIAENRCLTLSLPICVHTKVPNNIAETTREAHLSAKLNTNEFSEDSLARDSSSAQRKIVS